MSQITKRALEQSLKNLLLKKPLNKITISDITEDCGINRMTFYYHFQDIPALIEEIITEQTKTIIRHVLRMPEKHLPRRKRMTHGSRVLYRYLWQFRITSHS